MGEDVRQKICLWHRGKKLWRGLLIQVNQHRRLQNQLLFLQELKRCKRFQKITWLWNRELLKSKRLPNKRNKQSSKQHRRRLKLKRLLKSCYLFLLSLLDMYHLHQKVVRLPHSHPNLMWSHSQFQMEKHHGWCSYQEFNLIQNQKCQKDRLRLKLVFQQLRMVSHQSK